VNVKRTIAEFLMARCSSVTSEVVAEHWRKLDHQLASSSLSVVTLLKERALQYNSFNMLRVPGVDVFHTLIIC